jgi:hypothetical protein
VVFNADLRHDHRPAPGWHVNGIGDGKIPEDEALSIVPEPERAVAEFGRSIEIDVRTGHTLISLDDARTKAFIISGRIGPGGHPDHCKPPLRVYDADLAMIFYEREPRPVSNKMVMSVGSTERGEIGGLWLVMLVAGVFKHGEPRVGIRVPETERPPLLGINRGQSTISRFFSSKLSKALFHGRGRSPEWVNTRRILVILGERLVEFSRKRF